MAAVAQATGAAAATVPTRDGAAPPTPRQAPVVARRRAAAVVISVRRRRRRSARPFDPAPQDPIPLHGKEIDAPARLVPHGVRTAAVTMPTTPAQVASAA